jgi:hypothetical protein
MLSEFKEVIKRDRCEVKSDCLLIKRYDMPC